MGFSCGARLGVVAATLLSAVGIGAATPASACACGGVVNAGDTVSVHNEVAVLGWDGQRETILMQLALRSDTDNAALIVPTPTPATVAAGSPRTFAELELRTAPEVVAERRWFGSVGTGAADAGAPPGSGPAVLDQVRLGPLEATTLSGGQLDGVQKWLGNNGYAMRPEVTATLEPYLREGWSFVAMRLTSGVPLDGALDPVRLTFDSDRLVYPMRMSSAAKSPQSARLYVLGEHRVQRSDPDAARQAEGVDFAGRITDPADPTLRELTGNGHDYLTELWVSISKPATITSDLTFTAAPTDEPYRERITHTEVLQFLGMPAGAIILGAGLLAASVVVFAVIRTLRRNPPPPAR